MSSQHDSTTQISSSSQETSTSEEQDLALFINMEKRSSSCLSPQQSQDDTQGWQEGSQSPTSYNNVPMMGMFDADLNADFMSFTSNDCSASSKECSVSTESMEISDDTNPFATISPKTVVPPS